MKLQINVSKNVKSDNLLDVLKLIACRFESLVNEYEQDKFAFNRNYEKNYLTAWSVSIKAKVRVKDDTMYFRVKSNAEVSE